MESHLQARASSTHNPPDGGKNGLHPVLSKRHPVLHVHIRLSYLHLALYFAFILADLCGSIVCRFSKSLRIIALPHTFPFSACTDHTMYSTCRYVLDKVSTERLKGWVRLQWVDWWLSAGVVPTHRVAMDTLIHACLESHKAPTN